MKFSGHESFPFRTAWLPKAYRALLDDPTTLAREEHAMVTLGVGKNMVRSIRFWVEVTGLASPAGRGVLELTDFAHAVFGSDGFDPFLEDRRTLWLLHWRIATFGDDPVFAWRYLLGHWPHAEFTRSEAAAAFQRESERLGHRHSPVTLSQHLDVFVHTYTATRGGPRPEDSLDGPLVELELLQQVGDRRVGDAARREPVFSFRRGPKPDVTSSLFAYCLDDYWTQWRPEEATLTFRDVALAEGSVGQVFRLGEEDVRIRLEGMALPGSTPFRYHPSAVQGMIVRTGNDSEAELLRAVYHATAAPAGADNADS